MDALPFRLKNMAYKDFLEALEMEPIPSDSESVVDDECDVEGDVDRPENNTVISDFESDADDILPDSPEYATPLIPPHVPVLNSIVPQNSKNSNDWSTFVAPQLPADFVAESGVTDIVKDVVDPTPCKLFQLFFNDDLLNDIVFSTNLYAQQSFSKQKPTNLRELKTFLGINLLMGIKRLPSYRDYWNTGPDMNDAYVSSLMPVKRFSWLLSNLHLNDNLLMPKKGEPNYDKLYKVRPLLTSLSDSFKNCMAPTRDLSVDESMIKFKGRSTLKQYQPKKPIKRGYKVWILANQRGYCQKFEIYTGKSEDVEKELGARVVKKMVKDLENKHHIVYFDNFFNSTELQEYLKNNNIHACGTVNPKRKTLPKFTADNKLKRGQFEVFTNTSGVVAYKWKDKRSVHLLSNFHEPLGNSEVKRKEKNGSIKKVCCPKALIDYNANMNFVDKFDQNLNLYKVNRKSHKWWHRIFFYFLDATVVNAFVLYKELNLPKMSMKDFRRSILQALVSSQIVKNKRIIIGGETIAKKRSKPFVPPEIRQAESAHQPQRDSRRRCSKCSDSKKQVRTNWSCSVCKVPLCLGINKTCFQDFHRIK